MKIFGFLLDPDTKFGRLMTKIGTIVVVNLMFILGSIPVITIGASYTAMVFTMLSLHHEKKEINPFSVFWEAYKSNFKQATSAFVSLLVLEGLFYFEMKWCLQMGGFLIQLAHMWKTLMVLLVAVGIFVFPTIAVFNNKLVQLYKSALFFMGRKLWMTGLILIINLLPVTVTLLDEYNQGFYSFIWFFMGFALISYGTTALLLKLFSPYLDK